MKSCMPHQIRIIYSAVQSVTAYCQNPAYPQPPGCAPGSFPGWPKETGGALTHGGAHLDLSAFSSWEELASLGLDRLKSALMALGLKCGGTLEERAQRLFSTKGGGVFVSWTGK